MEKFNHMKNQQPVEEVEGGGVSGTRNPAASAKRNEGCYGCPALT